MKQFILGTAVGRALMLGRGKLQLMRAALTSLENVGTIANDQFPTTLITRLCQRNMTFVDVGAHIGSVVSEVQQHNPTVKCIAVEAMPDKAANLRRKFPQVHVYSCAVSDTDGEMSFFVNIRRSGYSSLRRPASASDADVREIRVQVRRSDSFVTTDGIDAIKIDVEGAELGALRGSVDILKSRRPTIMFESGPISEDSPAFDKQAIWQLLRDHNYCVLVPNRLAHNDEGLSEEGFCESHLYPRRTTNYFAVAKERRAEICDRSRRIIGVRVL